MQTLMILADAPPEESYEKLVSAVVEARQGIGQNFFVLGQALTLIKSHKLYKAGGFGSFAAFLRDKRIDIAAQDADRFMTVTQDPAFERNLNMGLSKMLELMKLPATQREVLLNQGATINGEHKDINDMNLKEMRQATQELKREGKSRCDRCRRWVDVVNELDGKFFGSGGSHQCFELEMEERRALSAGRIPETRVEQVLEGLRTQDTPADASPLEWLPDSLYQLYGQIIADQQASGGEVSREQLHQEQQRLGKLMELCQHRLGEIQEMLKVLDELES